MEAIIPIISAILFLGFLAHRLNRSSKSSETTSEETNNSHDEIVASIYDSAHDEAKKTYKKIEQQMNKEEAPDTIGLMFNTLSALGCQPTKNEDGTLSVSYQGENFHMEFGGMYARVWDPMWSGIKADDPELPEVREAVNAANFNFGPTVVMTAPDDEGVIGFHSRRDIMLHPACPDNVPFVKAVLDSFFDTKEIVRTKFQQLKSQQMEVRKNRRPVGFTTNLNTEKSEQE